MTSKITNLGAYKTATQQAEYRRRIDRDPSCFGNWLISFHEAEDITGIHFRELRRLALAWGLEVIQEGRDGQIRRLTLGMGLEAVQDECEGKLYVGESFFNPHYTKQLAETFMHHAFALAKAEKRTPVDPFLWRKKHPEWGDIFSPNCYDQDRMNIMLEMHRRDCGFPPMRLDHEPRETSGGPKS